MANALKEISKLCLYYYKRYRSTTEAKIAGLFDLLSIDAFSKYEDINCLWNNDKRLSDWSIELNDGRRLIVESRGISTNSEENIKSCKSNFESTILDGFKIAKEKGMCLLLINAIGVKTSYETKKITERAQKIGIHDRCFLFNYKNKPQIFELTCNKLIDDGAISSLIAALSYIVNKTSEKYNQNQICSIVEKFYHNCKFWKSDVFTCYEHNEVDKMIKTLNIKSSFDIDFKKAIKYKKEINENMKKFDVDRITLNDINYEKNNCNDVEIKFKEYKKMEDITNSCNFDRCISLNHLDNIILNTTIEEYLFDLSKF